LIASARHVLASSALIGTALFECSVGAVSATNEDPASATAMSGPRVLMIVFMAACQSLQCLAANRIVEVEVRPKTATVLPRSTSHNFKPAAIVH
jgi:hypothetical protein